MSGKEMTQKQATNFELEYQKPDEVHEVDKLGSFEMREKLRHEWGYEVSDMRASSC